MAGFFNEVETQGALKKDNCSACGLSIGCETPKIPSFGKGKKDILIVSDHPSTSDEKANKVFSGTSGKLLKSMLTSLDISLDVDCVRVSAVACRPSKGNDATNKEIQFCRNIVDDIITNMQPKLILLFGSTALKSVVGVEWKKDIGAIGKWRGFIIPSRYRNCWIAPMFSPVYVNKQKKDPVVKLIFKSDLKNAISYLDRSLPDTTDEKEFVRVLFDDAEILTELKKIYTYCKDNTNAILSFDYEGTGLKPHAEGHKIVCCSMCYDKDDSIVFPFPLSKVNMKWFKRIMVCEDIKKTAHNMKFEHAWTEFMFSIVIQGWYICSMQAAHIIDNRSYINGLKFQAYTLLGTDDYDSHIAPFLRASEKDVKKYGDNAINRIDQLPISEVMLYCGIDSLVQYRIVAQQLQILGDIS